MATEKTLNTRIVLKHDTLENWNKASLILKEGEIALAKVDTAAEGTYGVPTYLMKVGDGETAFASLKWVAATAADVYDWAKQKELPVSTSGAGNAVTSVTWDASANKILVTKGSNFEAAGAAANALNSAKAYSNENLKSAKAYADQAEADAVSTAAADATKKAGTAETNAKSHATGLNNAMDTRVKALETAVGVGGSVGSQIDAKINLLDVKAVTAETGYVISSVGQENGKVVVAKKQLTAADIPTLTVSKISDYATDVEKKITAKNYATKTEAQGYANAKDSAIAAAKKAGTDAQGTANTAVKNAATAQAAAEAAQETADTGVANAATAQSKANLADTHATDAQTRVGKIEADYLKKADKTELTKADAAQVERIAALEGKIDGVTGAMHFKGTKPSVPESTSGYKDGDVILVGNKEYVASGEAFVELGDTTQEGKDISNLQSRMTSAESKLTTIQGSGAGSINKALADAKSYADGKVSALANGQVNTNKTNIAANTANITKNTSAIGTNTSNISKNAGNISTNTSNIAKNTSAIAAINNSESGILAKAKTYADGLNTTMDGRVDKIEAKVGGWDSAASKANSAVQSVVEGDTNGTIKVDGTAVNVHGLGSAAYTSSGAYATAAQGKRADTAVQPSDLSALNDAKHTHSNKGELDKIASGDKTKWDAATTKANSALQDVTAGTGLKRTAKGQISFDDACVFVFDCGTSTLTV